MVKKKRSFISKLLSKRVLLLMQLVISLLFLGYIYYLDMLPVKYYLIVVGLILLIWLLIVRLINSGIKKKKQDKKYFLLIFSKLLSITISISLCFVSIMAVKGNNFLDNITGQIMQTRVISMYVKKTSDYKRIKDIKGDLSKLKVGIATEKSKDSLTKAIEQMEDELEVSFKLKDYKEYSLLGDAIMDDDIEVIIADNAYIALLEANHEGIDENLTSLYRIELQEKVKASTIRTDVTKKPFMMYITGIDTYGTVSAISRADVNLAVCVSPKQKQILIVSIPRDTQVNLHKNGKMDKITHSAMYGISETIATIEDFLDVEINYYAKTNFSGITNIIDALGGVTIDSPYEFTTLHGNYHINKGLNEMDGDKALCFVRERYALPSGDFDRGKNQQRLLKAMINKAISPKIITNYSKILQAVEGCFETNMSADEIKAFIQMQIDDMAKWEMFNIQLTGEGEMSYKTYSMKNKKCYTMVPDEDSLQTIIKAIDIIESGEKLTKSDLE